jgi:hypothetical protein
MPQKVTKTPKGEAIYISEEDTLDPAAAIRRTFIDGIFDATTLHSPT